MTEASEAATAYWFEALGKPVLRAPKAVANIASRNISLRGGMRLVGTEERGYVSGRPAPRRSGRSPGRNGWPGARPPQAEPTPFPRPRAGEPAGRAKPALTALFAPLSGRLSRAGPG